MNAKVIAGVVVGFAALCGAAFIYGCNLPADNVSGPEDDDAVANAKDVTDTAEVVTDNENNADAV